MKKMYNLLKSITTLWLLIGACEKLSAQIISVNAEFRPCIEDTSVFVIEVTDSTSISAGDIITGTIDFGDGQTDNISLTAGDNSSCDTYKSFYYKHDYTAIGSYTATYNLSLNGVPLTGSLSINIYNSGCERVSGRAFLDVNKNSIYDFGDYLGNGGVYFNNSTTYFIDSLGYYSFYTDTFPYIRTLSTSFLWIENFTFDSSSFSTPLNGVLQFTNSDLPLIQDLIVDSNYSDLIESYNQFPYETFCGGVDLYFGHFFCVGDSALTEINFGDGTDTIFYSKRCDPFPQTVNHGYTYPGNYQVMITGSSILGSDTVFVDIIVSDSCGDITGTVFADVNSNCIIDGSEQTIEGINVALIENGSVIQYDFTQANGIYSFENVPLGGNYTVELLNNGAYLPVSCPNSSGIQTVPSVPASGLDFALDASNVAGFNLSSILNIGTGFNRPGQQRYLEVCVRNFGFTSTDGTLVLELDPLLEVTNFNSPAPSNVSGNTITWDFTSLQANNPYVAYDPNGTECFSMYVLTDTTANIGDTLCLTLTANPIPGDTDPSNNVITLCAPVLNSYDPNDKSVSPSGSDAYGFVAANQTMSYTVRFQNTGNAEAFNIFILDTIDANLNLSTLEPVASSHAMDVQVTGRVVKFAFNNINLPDSNTNEPLSHGFVVYRIAQNANLQPGEVFENTAHIFFDYNPAIVTNTVVNTIEIPTKISSSTVASLEMSMYPNPAQNQVNISFETSALRNIQIRDLLGKTIQSGMYSNTQVKLDASQLSSGVYQIFVQEGDHTQVEKLIIKK